MDLFIQKLTKAYNQKTVFRDLNFSISSGSRFSITGPNGSGKSTLLKILSGGLLPSSGLITYVYQGQYLDEDSLYRHVQFVAPYNTVIEELTLREIFALHKHLGLLPAFDNHQSWISRLAYPFRDDRQVKNFSSGMKQRVKLGLALLDERPLILLDEPASNLDAQGKKWMFDLIENLSPDKTLVLASNDQEEIDLCTTGILLENHTH